MFTVLIGFFHIKRILIIYHMLGRPAEPLGLYK